MSQLISTSASSCLSGGSVTPVTAVTVQVRRLPIEVRLPIETVTTAVASPPDDTDAEAGRGELLAVFGDTVRLPRSRFTSKDVPAGIGIRGACGKYQCLPPAFTSRAAKALGLPQPSVTGTSAVTV